MNPQLLTIIYRRSARMASESCPICGKGVDVPHAQCMAHVIDGRTPDPRLTYGFL